MNVMNVSRPVRQAAALALLVAATWIVWTSFAIPLLDTITQDRDRITRSNALLARYKQLEASLPELQRQIDASKAASGADSFLPAGAPTLISTQVQGTVERMVSAAGGSLLSSRTLPRTQESGYDRYSVDLDFSATLSSLSAILYVIEASQPRLMVERLSVQVPENGSTSLSREGQPMLTANLRLAAFGRGTR